MTARCMFGCCLPGLCLLVAPAISHAQEPNNLTESMASPAKRVIKTERQKWTALRDARRLSEKAEAYEKQGKASEAEHTAEEALALEEQVRGPWHIAVASRLDQVADLYTAHKKESAADALYKRARAIRERALGTHPDVYERDGRELRPKQGQPAEKSVPNPPAAATKKP